MTQISLSKIKLNLGNPRFSAIKASERDALIALADAQTIALARDIAKRGLNPTKRLAVFKSSNGNFTTAEGNRRLTALKLLTNAALLDSLQVSQPVKTELRGMSKSAMNSLKEVDCAVFDTESDAAHWVRLEHTGRNGGVGTVPWNREESRRYDSTFYEDKPLELQALDYIRMLFKDDKQLSSRLESIPMAPLERISEIGTQGHFSASTGKKKFFLARWRKRKSRKGCES